MRRRGGDDGGIAGVVGVHELRVDVAGELGVHGQVDEAAILAGHLDGILHAGGRALFGDDVFLELIARENVVDERASVFISPRPV